MTDSHQPPRMPRVIRVPAQALSPRRLSPLRILLIAIGAIALCAGAWGLWKWQSLHSGMPRLPEVSELWQAQREAAIEFIDAEGKTLAVRGPRYGRAITVTELPKHVSQAFIAAEDKRFYEHDGADEAAIARAALSNAAAGETVSGASTITQQVVKNLVLDSRQTMQRKAQEITLARQLEKRMTKDEILSLYLNRIYFGAGLYGIDAASRFYFGKPPAELQIHEAALLAALPKAPSKLNLRDNLEGAKSRQLYVLKEMESERYISRQEAAAAREAPINIIAAPRYDPQLGYALDIAAERLKTLLPRVPGDAVVQLTIDPKIQQKTQTLLSERMTKDGKAVAASQVSALILDRNGAVVALTGGVDYAASPFNRVTQSRRQPGSSFKPFVYALALEDGYSPYDVFNDRPISIGKWQPVNYSGEYHGPMTLSEALARSTNTVAAELGNETNPERIAALAKRFGIASEMKPFPSIALGSQEVSLWELVRAYGVFQSGGYRMEPYLIARVTDSRGQVYFEHPVSERERVYPEDLAAEMNAMMMRVITASFGTGGRARIPNWTVAGKTGTSQESRDAWFVGFTAAYIGGVWVGNDDDSPMRRVTGGGLPAELWADIMKVAHEGKKPEALFGANRAVVLDPAAEQRITFYRGMAQAFAAASGGSRSASRGGPVQQTE
ncbi:MAG: penicillin-binding protein 1A [Hyphomonas sp.]|uniref:transglycosylase domain-containing protein n=1 Tax=Hyphomonas sp. TaxID=87 RepID=UPI001DC03FC5|nr:PBP1A family penicillin-binding protein [Hyphomonas sp.]MBA4226739.1 penicillin-binding protein 1A [Hyphomonas sp.]